MRNACVTYNECDPLVVIMNLNKRRRDNVAAWLFVAIRVTSFITRRCLVTQTAKKLDGNSLFQS